MSHEQPSGFEPDDIVYHGPFTLNFRTGMCLRPDGEVVHLAPRMMDLFLMLRIHELRSIEELMSTLGEFDDAAASLRTGHEISGITVREDTLRVMISSLRRLLGPD